jgi:uncharacterized membrane protein
MSIFDKILSAVLIAAIILCTGFIIYLSVTPSANDKFTEFYILNENGKTSDYPFDVKAGQPVTVVLGVINHEYQPANYKILIKQNGAIIKSVIVGPLPDKQKWEEKVDFTAEGSGESQSEFYLFKDDGIEPRIKDPLILKLNIKDL